MGTKRDWFSTSDNETIDLPEDSGSFDETALLEAMRDYRRREFAELAHLDS